MSENQIKIILEGMASQNETLKAIQDEQKAVRKELKEYKDKMEPVYKVFENVSGFNSITIWILKGLILLGAGISVIWGFLKYIKN